MKVEVRLHAILKQWAPPGSEGAVCVELPQGATVGDLIARLGIPARHAAMILSGDESLDASAVLRDGQEVHVFPPLAGGCPELGNREAAGGAAPGGAGASSGSSVERLRVTARN